MRKLQIAVIGYNKDRCTDEARRIAYEIGTEIACAGAILMCGDNTAGRILVCKRVL